MLKSFMANRRLNLRIDKESHDFIKEQSDLTGYNISSYLNLLIELVDLSKLELIEPISPKDELIYFSIEPENDLKLNDFCEKNSISQSKLISAIIYIHRKEYFSTIKPQGASPNSKFDNTLWKEGKIKKMTSNWFDNIEEISDLQLILLAKNYVELGDFERAQQVIDFCKSKFAHLAETSIYKGNLMLVSANMYRRKRMIKHAENLLYEIKDRWPETALSLHATIQLSVVNEILGNINESILNAEDALEDFHGADRKDKIKMYLRLSNLYAYKLDKFQAQKYTEKYKRQLKDIENVSLYSEITYTNRYSISLIRFGQYENAILNLLKVLSKAPESSQERLFVIQNLYICYLSTNQLDKAENILTQLGERKDRVSKIDQIKKVMDNKNIQIDNQLYNKYLQLLGKSFKAGKVLPAVNNLPPTYIKSIEDSLRQKHYVFSA
jgi:tetratricopeptide (TPR) repeat protein